MLNSLAAFVIVGFLNIGPLHAPGPSFARTADVGNAALPILFGDEHATSAILIAVVAVPVVWWLLYRSTLGFEIRTVGREPRAPPATPGCGPALLIVLTMSLCGTPVRPRRGVRDPRPRPLHDPVVRDEHRVRRDHRRPARARPPVRDPPRGAPARRDAGRAPGSMQITAKIPIEIIDVIQALILLFLAAESSSATSSGAAPAGDARRARDGDPVVRRTAALMDRRRSSTSRSSGFVFQFLGYLDRRSSRRSPRSSSRWQRRSRWAPCAGS